MAQNENQISVAHGEVIPYLLGASYITLDLQSYVALLGTRFVQYDPTPPNHLWRFLIRS